MQQYVISVVVNDPGTLQTIALTLSGDEAIMRSSKERAAEFRRQAAICLDVAQRISLKEDREQMMQVAERWLELAKRAEAEAD